MKMISNPFRQKSGRKFSKNALYILLILVLLVGVLPMSLAGAGPAQQTTNLAAGRPVVCSSVEFPCAEAVDGNAATRWASLASDPQWIYVDLGATYNVTRVNLTWEAAYGKNYQIQVSGDATNWTNIYTTTTGDGGTDDLTGLSGSGRYVRMYGTARGTGYGYSLWEYQVYGTSGGATNTPTRTNTTGPTATRTNTPNGPTSTFTRTPTSPVGASNTPTATTGAGCGATNVALNKTATASSALGGNTANMTVDGNVAGTRWESVHAVDPQWLQIDLGSSMSICRVKLTWEGAFASGYQIQTSTDAVNWTTISSTTTGDGGVDDLTVSGNGRYIRMNGTVRATQWGYSLWEMEVYSGSSGPTATPSRTNTPGTGPTLTPTRTPTPGTGTV